MNFKFTPDKLIIALAMLLLVLFGFIKLITYTKNIYSEYTEIKENDLGQLIETVEFKYKRNGKFWGEKIFKRQFGNIVCEANTITSVQTRIITNFLDLEVFCRDLTLDFIPVIEILPKPNTTLIGSVIQNVKGRLYSQTSREIFNFKKGRWDIAPSLKGLSYLQPYKDGWVGIYHRRNECPKLSVRVPQHRSLFCIDTKNESAILVWDEKIYVNDDGNLFVYNLPNPNKTPDNLAPTSEHLRSQPKNISPSKIVEGNDWSYFIVPINGKILWGGSGSNSKNGCAQLNLLNRKKHIIPYEECEKSNPVNDYFSITNNGASYLLGTYSNGNILSFNGNNSLRTGYDIKPLEALNYRNGYAKYLTSQSITITNGFIFVGLFPWGEVLYSDINSKRKNVFKKFRLFNEPKKNNKSLNPYYELLKEEIARKEKISIENVKLNTSHFTDGIHPYLLSQRIASSTVLDGRLCFSTANYDFKLPNKSVLSQVKNIDEYGKVHCANIPNQILISTKNTEYQVKIFEHGLSLYSAGVLKKIIKFDHLNLPLEKI